MDHIFRCRLMWQITFWHLKHNLESSYPVELIMLVTYLFQDHKLENIWVALSAVYMLPFISKQTPTTNKGSLTSLLDVFNQRLQISESPVTHLTYLASLFMKPIQMADLIGAYFVLGSQKMLGWHRDSREASVPLKAKWQFGWTPPQGFP